MIRKFLADTRDLVLDALAWVGLSHGSAAWQRERLRRRLRAMEAGTENIRRSVVATHRMCRECRTLVPVSQSVCSSCGASMAAVPRGGAGRLVRLLAPSLGSASTSLLGAIIVVYFALAFTAPGGFSFALPRATLARLGMKWTPAILAGDWWRLVNPIYLHASLIHLLFNAYALANLGPALEVAVGGRRLLVLFTGTGIFSFIVSALLAPHAASVGASGALFGLIGFGIVHGRVRGGPMFRALSQDLFRWAVFSFVLSLMPGIDWAAHLGGFVAGAALGLFVGRRPQRFESINRLWAVAAVVSVLLPIVGFLVALTG
jgi:rhomboid protease GluP